MNIGDTLYIKTITGDIIEGTLTWFHTDNIIILDDSWIAHINQIWQPQQDELCQFSNLPSFTPVIAKFLGINSANYVAEISNGKGKLHLDSFHYCKPLSYITPIKD